MHVPHEEFRLVLPSGSEFHFLELCMPDRRNNTWISPFLKLPTLVHLNLALLLYNSQA